MVARAFNPRTPEAEAGGSEFQGSLVYRVSSRTTQRNLIWKDRREGGTDRQTDRQTDNISVHLFRFPPVVRSISWVKKSQGLPEVVVFYAKDRPACI